MGCSSWSGAREYGVECVGGWLEVQPLAEGRTLGGAMHAVHAVVFPFHRQRALVAAVVERDDDGFEVDHAAPHAAKIPIAPRIAKAGVAAKHAHRAVALAPPDIFHVHVVD